MDEKVRAKVERILRRELRYTSSNRALNMLIGKMQDKLQSEPGSMEDCMGELEAFLEKYPIVAKVDLANIAAL